jgi:hypothetical protein
VLVRICGGAAGQPVALPGRKVFVPTSTSRNSPLLPPTRLKSHATRPPFDRLRVAACHAFCLILSLPGTYLDNRHLSLQCEEDGDIVVA